MKEEIGMKTYPAKTIQCSCKIRIYPDLELRARFEKIFSDIRIVYNTLLSFLLKEKINRCGLTLKNCFDFLLHTKEIKDNKIDLESYCINGGVYRSYRYYKNMKEGGVPRFLSKYAKKEFFMVKPNTNILCFRNKKKEIEIPGFGFVKCKGVSPKAKGKVQGIMIQKTNTGKYYLIGHMECLYTPYPLKNLKSPIGIDINLKHFGVFDDGTKLTDIGFSDKELHNIAVKQRYVSYKIKNSKNYEKAVLKFRKAFMKACNRKEDKIHKITKKIVQEHSFIATETIDLNEVKSSHRFARAFQRINFNRFFQQLEYKSKWNERPLIKVDRYYPSTKTCSCCGYVNHEIDDVSIREWTCPQCKNNHDRDVNAAKNILNEGKRIYMNQIET